MAAPPVMSNASSAPAGTSEATERPPVLGSTWPSGIVSRITPSGLACEVVLPLVAAPVVAPVVARRAWPHHWVLCAAAAGDCERGLRALETGQSANPTKPPTLGAPTIIVVNIRP